MKLSEILSNYHPWKHLLYALIFVSFALALSFHFDLKNTAFETAFRDYFTWGNFQRIVVTEPIKEEVAVRGPAWLILVLLGLVSIKVRSLHRFLNTPVYFKILPLHILFWLPLIFVNLTWSLDHVWPLITFTMGIIFGCVVFGMRGVLYGFPGIFVAIALHITFNLFTFLGTIGRIHLLQ